MLKNAFPLATSRTLVGRGTSAGSSRWLAGIAAAMLAYAGLFAALIVAHPFGGRPFQATSDLVGLLPPFFAGAIALLAAKRSLDNVRLAWLLIGGGCLAWGAGELIWTFYEVLLQADPFPSPADVGYLAALPLMALGIVRLSPGRLLACLRPTADGAAVILGLAAVVWFFVVEPTYQAEVATAWATAISLVYPLGDLILAYALVLVIARQWGYREGLALLALLAGITMLVAADLGFAYLTLKDAYDAYSLVNIGWPLAFLGIGFSAAVSAIWKLSYADEEDRAVIRTSRQAISLLIVPPALALIASTLREHSPATSAPLLALSLLAVFAVLCRMAISMGLAREWERSQERLVAWIARR